MAVYAIGFHFLKGDSHLFPSHFFHYVLSEASDPLLKIVPRIDSTSLIPKILRTSFHEITQ